MGDPTTPLEAIRLLLGDSASRRALTDDPSGTLAEQGFAGFTDDDVRLLLDHAGDTMPPATAAWMQEFGADAFVDSDAPAGLAADSIGDLAGLADDEHARWTDTDAATGDDAGLTGFGAPTDADVDADVDVDVDERSTAITDPDRPVDTDVTGFDDPMTAVDHDLPLKDDGVSGSDDVDWGDDPDALDGLGELDL